MASIRISVIALAVLVIVYEATAVCYLTKQMVEKEKRVFFVNKATGLQLLHTDRVNANTVLRMKCTEKSTTDVTCGANGQFSRKIPVGRCSAGMKPEVTPVIDASCPATMYRVGYQGNQNEFYRSCFDGTAVRALFSIHTAHDYTLVTNRPDKSFTLDGAISPADAETYRADKIYDRFKFLMGSRQKYIKNDKDIVFNRGHLTPSADFLFTQGMASTFKYINLIPQFGSINKGNWGNIIERWVRNHLRTSRSSTIVTGGLGVLQLPSPQGRMVDIYLAAGNRNPVPKFIFKIVVDSNTRIVFVTLNNIYASRAPPPICKRKNCPVTLVHDSDHGYTHCCDVTDFLSRHLPTVHL